MKTGIVGAGKVGYSIGKYLKEHDIAITGYYSKSRESAESAATFTSTAAFPSLRELAKASDMIFIATPDDVIRSVWEDIMENPVQGKIVCHFSGSLSSVVFSGREQAGVSGCSAHPMYAFSSKYTSYEQLDQVPFTMEGDKKALDAVKSVLEQAGIRSCVIDSAKKERYHAAASMVSNMMIGLYQMGIDMLQDCGFEKDAAQMLVNPLVQGNIHTLLTTSPERALTGPIERCDMDTVKKHLAVLKEEEQAVYKNLAQKLVEIAMRKNPGRDYEDLMKII